MKTLKRVKGQFIMLFRNCLLLLESINIFTGMPSQFSVQVLSNRKESLRRRESQAGRG